MPEFKTRPVTRNKLAQFLGSQELIKLFENLADDISTTLPSLLDEISQNAENGTVLARLVQGLAIRALELGTHAAEVPQQPTPPEPFPVGSIFTSTVSTDPSQLLGYGVWAAYAAGRVLTGYAAGDPDFGVPGGTGGAKTVAISAHAGTAVADHADHTHDVNTNVTATTDVFAAGATPAVTSITNNPVTTSGASIPLAHVVTQPNNHADISVIQPYITVYFWLRTA